MTITAHMAYNFNCLLDNDSHVHCKCGNISETAQDGVVVTADQEVMYALSNSGNIDDLD